MSSLLAIVRGSVAENKNISHQDIFTKARPLFDDTDAWLMWKISEYRRNEPRKILKASSKLNSIHLLSAEIVRRIKGSQDSNENCCQVIENLIRESNL